MSAPAKPVPVVVAVSDYHAVEKPSDQAIGRLFGWVFVLLALWRSRVWADARLDAFVLAALAAAAIFFALAQFAPRLLAPLNKVWMGLGFLLGRVVSPIVLFVLYAVVIVPSGLLRQWLAKPAIAMGKDAALQSYWVLRDPPGPKPETLQRPY